MFKRSITINIFLLLLVVTAVVIATGMGFLAISSSEVLRVLLSSLFGWQLPESFDPVTRIVVLDVRLPRILTAVLVGGGLAVAGGVFQALLLNPLADPYTLGISSGAAFGAALAIIFSLVGIALPHWFIIPLFAMTGSILTLLAVFALSSKDKTLSSHSLILSGVIISAILSAGIGFIKYLADEEVNIIIFWLMGSFVGKSWGDVLLVLSLCVPCLLLVFIFSRDLNVMSLGQKTSDSLGIDTSRVRRKLLIAASLITAACVSVSGIIGFVGLIIPHLLRLVMGADNRALLPACFFAGGLLLLVADTLTRAILPSEVPIGILTSLIGGPFFCYIFRRKRQCEQP